MDRGCSAALFVGGEATLLSSIIFPHEHFIPVCVCTRCGACGPSCGSEDEACKTWNIAPRPLEWTAGNPTEVGWYWNRTRLHPEEVSVLYLTGDKIKSIRKRGLDTTDEWAGPIPKPRHCEDK